MAGTVNPQPRNDLGIGRYTKTYASIAADTDLVTDRPGYSVTGDSAAILPRQVIVNGAGNLDVTYANGQTDDIDSIIPPYTFDIQPRLLRSTTSATKITVVW